MVERACLYLGWCWSCLGRKICGFSSSYPGQVLWLGCCLLVPLGVSSGFRIYQQNNQQLSSQLNQQTTQMKQLRNLLSKTSEELRVFWPASTPQGRQRLGNPEQVKSQLLSEIAQTEKSEGSS